MWPSAPQAIPAAGSSNRLPFGMRALNQGRASTKGKRMAKRRESESRVRSIARNEAKIIEWGRRDARLEAAGWELLAGSCRLRAPGWLMRIWLNVCDPGYARQNRLLASGVMSLFNCFERVHSTLKGSVCNVNVTGDSESCSIFFELDSIRSSRLKKRAVVATVCPSK